MANWKTIAAIGLRGDCVIDLAAWLITRFAAGGVHLILHSRIGTGSRAYESEGLALYGTACSDSCNERPSLGHTPGPG